MPTLNIDTSAVVVFTNKLEKLGRSALPVAVRSALNSAAFDVKQNTMLKSARSRFINRTETFFKANSAVDMATGFNIKTMAATVGFTSSHLRIGSTNFSVKDLEQQEYSGDIKGKTFIPLDTARSGGHTSLVRPANRLTTIKQKTNNFQSVINANKIFGSKRGAFVKAAFKAGSGGYVFGNAAKEILWRIDAVIKNKYGIKISKTALYSVRKGRSVGVKETGFMRWASLQSANKLEDYFIKAAQLQIDKMIK